MKIRSDFVSNSSSSSFILQNDEAFEYFNVTKQDIVDVLTEMYGKENYDKYVENDNKRRLEHPDWYANDKGRAPFYVYDMTIEADRKEAIERWGDMLDEWPATDCERDPDGSLGSAYKSVDYVKMCEALNNLYNFDNFYDYKPKKHMTIRGYDENGPTEKAAPQFVIDFLEDARRRSGIMTNKEVLEHECSRFFVHFEDNELWTSETQVPGKNDKDNEIWNENDVELAKRLGKPDDGYTEKLNLSEDEIIARGVKMIRDYNKQAMEHNRLRTESKYETEYCTKDRVFEVLFNHLVKAGKIKPDDNGFLDEMFPPTEWEKSNGSTHHTMNGKNYSWTDLAESCLTFNGHEG